MRLLITGGSGDLGRPLSALAAQGWDTTVTYYRNPQIGGGAPVQLDLRDRDATLALVRETAPAVIIHTATSDRSEDMAAANRAAAQNILDAARAVGARLLAMSTDMVFDGTMSPYDEYAPPAPKSPYGRVKAQNEELFQAYPHSLIVRTSLIYDFDSSNRQITWMQDKIERGEPVGLFVDEVRQPIWVWNMAEALLELARSDRTGILNVAGPVPLDRWRYGIALLRALGYDPAQVAVPVRAAEVAPGRPPNCTLKLDRAREALATPLLDMSSALEAYQARKG
jgi:dTDP-4-dehydrorhamnose reductase